MIGLIMKMIQSYGVAGGIAEQAISLIRTVYSYVGEKETLDRSAVHFRQPWNLESSKDL